jgi:hypothetical protein
MHCDYAVPSFEFLVSSEPETGNLKPICLSTRSKAEGTAAFARVGAAYKGARFGMNHDGVRAAERFRIAGDNLVALSASVPEP